MNKFKKADNVSTEEISGGNGNTPAVRKRSLAKPLAVVLIALICVEVIVPFIKNHLATTDTAVEENVITVEEECPQIRTVQTTAKVVGTVTSEDSRDVMGKVQGEIISLSVDEGDYVSEGDLICVIDSDDLTSASLSVDSAMASLNSAQVQVQNAQLNVQSSETNLANAKKDLERYQAVYDAGSISLSTLEQYKNAVTTAQSALDSSKNSLLQAQYSQAQAQAQYELQTDSYTVLYNNLYVKASTSGTIESLNVHVHDMVTGQTPICTIAQKTDMQIVCEVAESVAAGVKVGDTARITQKGSEYSGVIQSAGKDADENTGTYEIKIHLNGADSLACNSKATVYLNTDSSSDALTIPYDAVYYDSGEPYVYVDEDGTAAVRYIETGIYDDEYIVVSGGLDSGDKVITSWSSSLTNGTKVTADSEKDSAAANSETSSSADKKDQEA